MKSEIVYVRIDGDGDFEKFRGKLTGKLVMLIPMREVAARFEPLAAPP